MRVLTKKYGEVNIRWQYGLFNGDRDVTKAFLEKKEGKNATILKEISVVKNPKEKNDKISARYFSLSKLLQESFSEIKTIEENGKSKIVYKRTPEDLEDRSRIWDVFKTTVKVTK